MNTPIKLSAKDENSLGKTVTTRELAEMLGVEKRTIQETANRLLSANVLSHLETKSVVGGKTFVFDEEQATLIKQEIQKHHNLAGRQIDNVSTDLEILANASKAFSDLQELYKRKEAEYKAIIAEQKSKVDVYDRISDGTGCFSMNQTAKALKLPYGNIKLYEKLRSMGILNADNSPKQEQIDAARFKVVVKFINEKVGSKPVTLTTAKGLVYLAKKFNTEIDHSVKADM